MSSSDDKDGERPHGSSGGAAGGAGRPDRSHDKKKRPLAPEVGNALRSAYQRTLDESIPPEMLDLLGKLG